MKRNWQWRAANTLVFCLGLTVVFLAADNPNQEPSKKVEKKITIHSTVGGPLTWESTGGDTTMFIASEVEHMGKPIKGAPYSAEAVTEFTQVLGDGNRIQRKSTAMLYRDSEGRTRREQVITSQDAAGADTTGARTIFINDPAAQVSYVVLPADKVVRKLQTSVHVEGVSGGEPDESDVLFNVQVPPHGDSMAGPGKKIMVFHSESSSPGDKLIHTDEEVNVKRGIPLGDMKKESLGTQTIEGVAAEGTKISHTIPAGKVGNDLPITVVTETWFSKELGTVVLSKTTDPRMGDTVYRLTNLSRNEPARSLFEIPADYQVEEGKREIMIKKKVVREN
jgi:hypothetical protein